MLIVSPHPDDETLGVGGTAAKCAGLGHEVTVLTVSGHLPPLYSLETYEQTVSEARAAFKILGIADYSFLEVPATMVGKEPVHILNERILSVVRQKSPQIVLCPFPDRHVDHRAVFESVMVATRPIGAGRDIQVVAAYETLSETQWNAPYIEPNFVPNWVVDITDQIDVKLRALRCYASQITPFPGSRSEGAAEALAKFRGSQAGFGFGEAFHIIRMRS